MAPPLFFFNRNDGIRTNFGTTGTPDTSFHIGTDRRSIAPYVRFFFQGQYFFRTHGNAKPAPLTPLFSKRYIHGHTGTVSFPRCCYSHGFFIYKSIGNTGFTNAATAVAKRRGTA